MKILEVITSLRTGGAESLISDLVPLMNDERHHTDVLVFDGTETPFMDKLVEKGVKVYALKNGTNVYNLKNIIDLLPFIKQYDIVHTHNTACQMYVAISNKFVKNKTCLVTTEHSTDNRRRHIFWFKPIDKWMYRQYSGIAAISEDANSLLKNYIGSYFRVLTIPNGIDTGKFINALPYPEYRKDEDVIISMVAAFRREKDQDTLIRAFVNLPSRYKVWLIGDGIRRKECESLAEELGISDRVKFWGIRTDVPRMLKTSDIIVMSTHYEGMSLSNIEGMCSGRPFVASDVKGIREVTSGAGVLFEEGNSKQLADIIIRLTEDRKYREDVIQRCLEQAKSYDIAKTAQAYLKLYDSLVK
jgi:glycosyltransferase involved in cell wall biosynthesis